VWPDLVGNANVLGVAGLPDSHRRWQSCGQRTAELLAITWISAIASDVVDNIPFTATMIPVVEQLQGRVQRGRLLVGARAGRVVRRQLHARRRCGQRRAGRDGRAQRPADPVRRAPQGRRPATLVSLVPLLRRALARPQSA
jgi:hypothetical protein